MSARRLRLQVAAAAVLALLAGSARADCPGDETHFRLYQTSPILPGVAIHVATFDSIERAGRGGGTEAYNRENCEIARRLFQSQPGVISTYWCERVQPRP